jgi:hypothetical protein
MLEYNSIEKINELIKVVNNKLETHKPKQPLSACIATKNKKIKIIYANGCDENFGSFFDCVTALDVMYNLRLFWENYIFIKGNDLNNLDIEDNRVTHVRPHTKNGDDNLSPRFFSSPKTPAF